MPLNIPTGYYEVSMHHSLTGSLRLGVVTCGFQYTGSAFGADSDELADLWASQVMPELNNQWHYFLCRFRDATGTVKERSETTAGSATAAPTTPNVAFLAQKLTGLGGRKNRGRMYIPGVSEDNVDGVGNVTSGKVASLDAALGVYVADAASFHFTPVILHNSLTAPTPFTGFSVSGLAATQRRRLRK